jgi:hypothetical protein
MAADFLDVILEHCNISLEQKDFIVNKLFKYKNNPIVESACNVVRSYAEGHAKFLTMCREANIPIREDLEWPLIIAIPDNPTTLRVFPNIILNTHTGLENVNSSTCTITLKKFLEDYEADIAHDKKKQKWEPQERVEKYLNEYLDMQTSTVLARFIFTDGSVKASTLRDYAERIDDIRKPLELIFAEKPEDFVTMYGSGPQSCMAYSAGDRQTWLFLEEKYNLCPASWYAYYPKTKGVYSVKAGKVVARVILFQEKDNNWYYGRVYSTNPEVDHNFRSTLELNGIRQLSTGLHTPQSGIELTIPGVMKNSTTYAIPWPYFDNIPRGEINWYAKFDKTTNEFTIQYKPSKLVPINNRSGHLISTDYFTLECSSCGNIISRQLNTLPVEAGEYVFCSDNCAASMDYCKVIEGSGAASYKKLTEDMIEVKDDPYSKFSTFKAAQDCGYLPCIEELNIFPEENDYKVINRGDVRADNAIGERFLCLNPTKLGPINFTPNKVPYVISGHNKVIEYNEEEFMVEV